MSAHRPPKNDNGSVANDLIDFFTSAKFILALVFFYIVVIGILLLAELDVRGLSQFRATDKVVILFVLLFMPFFVVAAPKFINSLTVKFGGGKEVAVQLNQVSEKIDEAFDDMERNIARQVNTAEQALWPMLAGINPKAELRWRSDKPKIIIGSKEDASHIFFANFIKHWLEKNIANLDCIVKFPNGGSLKNFADVKYQWIDIYIDFTGTCCQYFNIDHHGKSDQDLVHELNSYCEPQGIKFLKPWACTENFLLVMRESQAKEIGIKTISDLARLGQKLTFTADPEYLNRNDCWLGLQREYGIRFADVIPCNVVNRYALLDDDLADVFVGYETDPEIKLHNLVALEDDREFFPSYRATPLVCSGLLEAIPAIETQLNRIEGKITTESLIKAVQDITNGLRSLDSILADSEKEVLKTP
ncbi:ABC transporter substrate-binding protein [Aurantivibrio plasticivorans]